MNSREVISIIYLVDDEERVQNMEITHSQEHFRADNCVRDRQHGSHGDREVAYDFAWVFEEVRLHQEG